MVQKNHTAPHLPRTGLIYGRCVAKQHLLWDWDLAYILTLFYDIYVRHICLNSPCWYVFWRNAGIQILSEGYDSQLTDDASSLSPAVKQKLAIARALIRNPKVLVLDDIFANLDIQNELQILDNISELARGRTLIIISQQIWYLKHCRKIVYMENGEIKQIGSTKEVMSQEGPIKEFSNQQLKVVSNRLQGQHNLIFDEMK